MKKGLILLGSIPVALLTAAFLFNGPNAEEGVYKSRNSTFIHESSTADGMLEYYHKLRGDYTHESYLRIKEQVNAMPVNRAVISWQEQGPDNVGGRTRAILVDRSDINHIYAGSVSGGLFESWTRASFWEPVDLFADNLAISSMCQTLDGTIYIATGHSAESSTGSQNAYDSGANGKGVFVLQRDANLNVTGVSLIAGTEVYSDINEVVCDDVSNRIWIATNQGLKRYTPGVGLEDISNGLTPGACNSLSISKDGTLIVAGMSSGKTNVSQDGGNNFLDMTSSSNTVNPISAGAARIEYAISHERADNNNYYVYASAANNFLLGIWMSSDNGSNWTQIAPANNQQPGSFSPFSTGGGSGQGTYDNIISAVKGNPKKLILGGIDLYSWATTGNWTQLSQWFLAPQSPQYAHADQHELVWDDMGRLYVGNDGGVAFSDDGGETFHPANRGYNVTQFYAIGASAHGDVIGGAQDNGTQANYHDNSTWHEFDEVGGGDGFSSEISFINRNILFSSVYYASIRRSADRGQNSNSFIPVEFSTAGTNSLGCNPGATDGSGCGQFFTNFKLWENPNDNNSTDSVSYVPQEAYQIGDTVFVPSMTAQTSIEYICPINVVFDDTLYYDPAATGVDTVITSITPSNDYNLSVFEYSFVFGSHPITAGDSIYLVAIDTTVVVDSYSTIPHYYGTNPADPGDTLDMGNDSIAYAVAWDTLIVQDPYQSWMAIGLGGGDGIWMTRNALRLSASSNAWFRVNHTNIGQVSTMEFSRDGNHLFVGTWSGQLYRLSGFGDVYSPVKDEDTLIDVNTVTNVANLQTTWTAIHPGAGFGAPVTGIGVEGDLDHVVVTLGNYTGSGKVRETNNATGAATWTTISGNLPSISFPGVSGTSLPVYSVVIDRDDPNTIVIGTDMGAYITSNGGTLWENCSEGFGNVPIFDMRQNWRTYNEGCLRPGEIYMGSHGRGIWSSDAFLSLPGQQDQLEVEKYVPNMNVYPNPMIDQGNLAFTLESSSNVNIQIYSLSGRLVQEINKTNMAAGENNVDFNVAELPKGAYIIKLTAGNKVETSKFIKH
ncbi:MAG: T9SS type A sorting domain-containing protein [Crocinitomicaceae bacterium]|nr:T9SS type A sorting domain-containing protein [Crocinitomicaceae bacterium]